MIIEVGVVVLLCLIVGVGLCSQNLGLRCSGHRCCDQVRVEAQIILDCIVFQLVQCYATRSR